MSVIELSWTANQKSVTHSLSNKVTYWAEIKSQSLTHSPIELSWTVLLQEIETWAMPLMKKTRRSGWSRRIAVARWDREASRSLGWKYKCSWCQNLLVYFVHCLAPDIHILLESSSMFCREANSWMDGPSKWPWRAHPVRSTPLVACLIWQLAPLQQLSVVKWIYFFINDKIPPDRDGGSTAH